MGLRTSTKQQLAAAPEHSPNKRGQRRTSVTSDSTVASTASARSLSTLASDGARSQFSARSHQPLGDLSCNAEWSSVPDVPRLIVRVKGRSDPVRVPLRTIMSHVGGADDEPVLKDAESGLGFLAYLSQEVGEHVTALYYLARMDGRGALQYVAFDERRNPFVGGMEVVACVDGDDMPPEPADQSGCSVM